MKYSLILLAVLIVGVGLIVLEQKRLVIRRQTLRLPSLPDAFDGFRVVQLSDLHKRVYPHGERRLLQKVQQCQPDIIVITGDLVSRSVTDFTERTALLKVLRQMAPVYLSLGNHEWDMQPQQMAAYQAMVKQSGCVLLENETVTLQRNGMVCYLAGASLRIGIYHDAVFAYRDLESYTAADLTADLGERKGCTILLAHSPFPAESYFTWGADLTLSGHVHGGIVRLPIIGGLLSPERRFLPQYSKGIYEKDGRYLYVNCGIGKLRLGNPSEVAEITLRSENSKQK
ncbi:MAG: metallophosphoesterase [Oscillospiraceae bacterium]|nr:metallophosphoesterase [Oscillospiraceae bacterium]